MTEKEITGVYYKNENLNTPPESEPENIFKNQIMQNLYFPPIYENTDNTTQTNAAGNHTNPTSGAATYNTNNPVYVLTDSGNVLPQVEIIDAELGGDGAPIGFNFSDESIRKGFIRKVYSILTIQLTITLIVICWFGYHQPTNQWMKNNYLIVVYVLLGTVVVTSAIVIAFICIEAARKTAPLNYILLIIFTIGESYLIGCLTVLLDPNDVLIAMGLTTVVCLSLTIFAFITKWDFTVLRGTLYIVLILLILLSIVGSIYPNKLLELIYSVAACIIFSIYLIYDTQTIIGGEHRLKISPEEYILGAIALYLDILNIFVNIIRTMQVANEI